VAPSWTAIFTSSQSLTVAGKYWENEEKKRAEVVLPPGSTIIEFHPLLRNPMTDHYRCSCGYQFGTDTSGPEEAVLCPGCGRPFLASMLPDQVAITRLFDAAPADPPSPTTEHVVKLQGKPAPTPPPDVPGYEILGELGRGGMGVVYKAREKSLNRLVALKMILAGAHAAEADRVRFRKEAEAVAALQHPGIVQIFHIDEHAGQPYLALEYVEGGNLAQQVLSGELMPVGQAAAAVEQLARAMQYAHDQGIIHRDLKPANVLLTTERGTRNTEPKPKPDGGLSNSSFTLFKISDFGLAKKLDETVAAGGGTKSGAVMGTPSYISPEQAAGKASTVTVRTDVYSLGAILYELLTGRPPFKADTPLETIYQVVHDDPVPPSRLRPKLPRDLETICLKCLEKDPNRRYATAAELADDLSRFQRGVPILAQASSPLVRGWKWAKRHPAISTVAAMTTLALATVVSVLAVSAARLADMNQQIEKEAEEAREQKRQADLLRAKADEQAETLRKTNQEMKEQDERNRRNLYALLLTQVAGLCEKDPARATLMLDDPTRCPPEFHDFAWRYLRRLCIRDERIYVGRMRPLPCVAVSPDGLLVATGDSGGQVRLWSPRTHASFNLLVGHEGAVNGVAFAPDGTTLATTGADGTVRVWKLPHVFVELVRASSRFLPQTQAELTRLIPPNISLASTLRPVLTIPAFSRGGRCVAFSPDGRWLAAGGSDHDLGIAKLWNTDAFQPNDLSGGLFGSAATTAAHIDARGPSNTPIRPFRTFNGHFKPVLAVAFSPDGRTLATGGEDAGVQLNPVEGDSRPENLRQHGGPVYGVAFSPDGRTLATTDNGAEGNSIVLWDLTRRRPSERARLMGHTAAVHGVAFSPDSRTLASTGGHERDATLRLWDVPRAVEQARLIGHTRAVKGVSWLPDQRSLVTASDDGSARVWQTDLQTCDTVPLDPDEPRKVLTAAVCEKPRTLITAEATGAVRMWSIDRLFDGRRERAEWPFALEQVKENGDREWPVESLSVTDSGQRIAVATLNGVTMWDLANVKKGEDGSAIVPARRLLHGIAAHAVRFSSDGRTVYAATAEGLRTWNGDTGAETTTPAMREHAGRLYPRTLAVSPVGAGIAVNTVQGSVSRLTLLTTTGATHVEVADPLLSAEFSPDGTMLITVVRGRGTRIWAVDETANGVTLRPIAETSEAAVDARFSRDGASAFCVGVNRDIGVVDPLTGQGRTTLSGHTDRIVGFGTLGKDTGLISVGRDGTVKRWRADPPQRLFRPPLRGPIRPPR
jgi:serine/threonine protein kinase/WD40 repeat protein